MPEPESSTDGPILDQRGEQDAKLDPKSLQDAERERLRNFPDIPDNPAPEDGISHGVLLSDQIKRLVNKYRMIHPFDEKESLKAASYELRVGAKYGKAGVSYDLADKQAVTIQPFDVVLIQTLETLNLPRFIIARWNIRIKWAYKGLLWVGAPQVDPGFRGFLSCPLYNLSSNPVELKFGEQFAAMDFVRTTEVTSDSKPYKWDERTRIVFEDYEKDKLESALVTRAAKRLTEMGRLTAEHAQVLLRLDQVVKSNEASVGLQIQTANQRLTEASARLTEHTENSSKAIQARMDSYTSTTFTVIAFLFAALGLALTKSPEFSFWSSSAPLAAIALWFALRAFYFTRSTAHSSPATKMWFEIISGAILAVVFLTIQYEGMKHNYAEWTASRESSSEAKEAVAKLKNEVEASRELRTRVDALQLQIDSLKLGLPKPQPSPTPNK